MKARKTPYWWRAIESAKRRKKRGLQGFTWPVYERALGWITCACGKQDKRIPRGPGGKPEDSRLTELGGSFAYHVGMDQIAGAERTLRAIERRAVEVLAQEGK